MQSQAEAANGRGGDINAAFGNLPGFVSSAARLTETLDAQGAAVSETISATGDFFDAISARDGELRGLIADSNTLFETTAERNRDLAAIWQQLPRFERESRVTLTRLSRFADTARPVVRQLQPAANEMEPTFAELQRLAPEFRGLFAQLGPVITASEKGLPAFDRILARIPPLLGEFQPFLRNANPIVRYIGEHRREVTAFFANVTAASLSRDVGADTLTGGAESVITCARRRRSGRQRLANLPRALGSTRQNAYTAPGAFDRLADGLPSTTPASVRRRRPGAADDRVPRDADAVGEAVRVPHRRPRRRPARLRRAGEHARLRDPLPAAAAEP